MPFGGQFGTALLAFSCALAMLLDLIGHHLFLDSSQYDLAIGDGKTEVSRRHRVGARQFN